MPKPRAHDERWVKCHRPAVLVGGELTVEMLDLQFNPSSKFYVGPVQMKANNGVLIIDDFGRQRLRPEELLNRWVVPLDRRIDFLTLAGGKKIEMPFEMLVVFASNIDPASLVDPAFLRRIQTKIKLSAPSPMSSSRNLPPRRHRQERRPAKTASARTSSVSSRAQLSTRNCAAAIRATSSTRYRWAARFEGTKPTSTAPP
jgi:hypothetical protein